MMKFLKSSRQRMEVCQEGMKAQIAGLGSKMEADTEESKAEMELLQADKAEVMAPMRSGQEDSLFIVRTIRKTQIFCVGRM
jgi:hypothetical protein